MKKISQNTIRGLTIRFVKTAQGWQQRERQTTRANMPRAFWIEILTGYFIYSFFSFFFIESVRCGNARATRRKPAKEARVRSYAVKIFVGAIRERVRVGFLDGCRCWQGGVRREKKSGRCDVIKETRSTRRFFSCEFHKYMLLHFSYIQHHHYQQYIVVIIYIIFKKKNTVGSQQKTKSVDERIEKKSLQQISTLEQNGEVRLLQTTARPFFFFFFFTSELILR